LVSLEESRRRKRKKSEWKLEEKKIESGSANG